VYLCQRLPYRNHRAWIAGFTVVGVLSQGFIATSRATDNTPGAPAAATWIAIPGGIADARGTVAYVANAKEGVDALDMVSGDLLWDTKQAVHPLALDGARLIAQAPRNQKKPSTMNIVVLDSATGKVIADPRPINFPDWIAVDGGIGLKFDCVASVEDNDLIISWVAERQFAGIVEEKAKAAAAATARKVESGIARMNLETGQAGVNTDSVLRVPRLPREKSYYDVADKRLNMVESTEDVPGGIRLIHRMLNARDARTGKPLWRHEIAGDVILPANLPATADKTSIPPASPRRR